MFTAAIVMLMLFLHNTQASNCGDLSGTWRNELGSTIMIKHDVSSNYITGRYKTVVSTSTGAAKSSSNVTGWCVPVKGGAVVSFSVLFNGGATVTVWVGQCNVCEGKEYIFASYALRKYVEDPKKRWMSTIINQNTFWKDNYLSLESNFVELEPKEGNADLFTLEKENSRLYGDWVSEDGSKVHFASNSHENLLEGKYEENLFTGRSGFSNDFTAISMVSASMKQTLVKAWTGHIYEKEAHNKPVLQTSWIEHTFDPNCKSSRNLVRFGMQNYTKTHDGNQLPVTETFLEKIKNFFKHLF